MKAHELAVGDWVKVPDLNKHVRVNAVYPTMISPNPYDDDVHPVIGDEYFKPIPLTPELLKLNGFVWDGMEDYTLAKREGDSFYSIRVCPVQSDNDDWWNPFDTGFEINYKFSQLSLDGVKQIYLHQLQQAMRMVGLDGIINWKFK